MITTSNQPTTSPHIKRQTELYKELISNGLNSLILNAGPSLTYLTGLHFHLSERPVLVFFILGRTPILVLPELEMEKIKHLAFEIEAFSYGEDPQQWANIFQQAFHIGELTGKKNGVEPRQLRVLELRLLLNVANIQDFVPADDCVSSLRMFKDETELVNMQIAAQIAERALTATLPLVKIGLSERELAAELTLQLLRAGCDPELPFSPIVSSGPNSANPHATPSDRTLTSGDLLVIDWGASYQGYVSDITRTYAIGKMEPELIHISQIVKEANLAGRNAIKPGIAIGNIDKASRDVISTAGYGNYFTHRTGHGLGMEGHEEPYVRAGNLMRLEPGMTFTIEPGIYLPGRNGVRIEDDVVVTETGADCLTSLPRDVIQLV
jgi:Xaa-Pro dipeptidase